MIDINKKYKTRNGRDVRIYSVDNGGEYPVHGACRRGDDEWTLRSWTSDGNYINLRSDFRDLVEVKKTRKVEGWRKVVIFPNEAIQTGALYHPTKETFEGYYVGCQLIGDWQHIEYEIEDEDK